MGKLKKISFKGGLVYFLQVISNSDISEMLKMQPILIAETANNSIKKEIDPNNNQGNEINVLSGGSPPKKVPSLKTKRI